MPYLKHLVRQAVQHVAQDPRVRKAAKDVFEQEIKPRAKTAWEKAKPEVEAAWERAKPEVEAAKNRAVAKAADLTDRVKREFKDAQARRADEDRN